MTPKTSLDYQKLTEHFFLTKVRAPLSISSIESALMDSALNYRPAYWRRLKRAIQHTLEIYGRDRAAKAISMISNPVTERGSPLQKLKKPKQKRVKRVRMIEHEKLMSHFAQKQDILMLCALDIVNTVGCRPIELMSLKFLGQQYLFIEGAKKTNDGLRGLNRTLRLDEQSYQCLLDAFKVLKQASGDLDNKVMIKRLQRRLQTATKAIWPRRQHHITFYSYRHQMGSDLKSSGLSPEMIAAIMGHQSTTSVEKYGDRRTGSSRELPTPTQATVRNVRTPKSNRISPSR